MYGIINYEVFLQQEILLNLIPGQTACIVGKSISQGIESRCVFLFVIITVL